jgi:YHS domain-containing protein
MKTKLAWLGVVCGLALGACGGGASTTTETASTGEHHDHDHGSGGEATATGPLVPVGQATIGDRSTCTVSGEEITITESSPHAEHDGRTYYFCCPHCLERFQANPHEFLPADHEQASAEPVSS